MKEAVSFCRDTDRDTKGIAGKIWKTLQVTNVALQVSFLIVKDQLFDLVAGQGE